MKKWLFSVLTFCSLGTYAQVQEWNWEKIGRPEHIESYVTDSNGSRKAPRKMGEANSKILDKKSPRIPVILVEFPDRKFYAAGKTHEEVLENYDLFFNGFDDNLVKEKTGSYGSVFAYFDDMSQGKFTPDFDILGPYELDNGYAYYGQDGGTKDIHFDDFCSEATSKAIKDVDLDWTVYDNDNDGKVDIVFFIYAGWGQNVAKSNDLDALWPKEMTQSKTIKCSDGTSVTVGMFGVTSEARPIDINEKTYNPDKMKMDGIGVCLHELSHALGMPDFYDTNNKGFGMDLWSIMDYGEYCVDGYQPVGYTAYERNFLGWEPLEELTEPQVLTLKCFADGGVGYKIVSDADPDEYYVIENRQGKGWDTYLGNSFGHGMQVTHVHYNRSKWLGNTVNTDVAHQRMSIIAANDSYVGTNMASSFNEWKKCLHGQLYPGESLNYNLTDESTPAATLFKSPYLMSKPLRNITENEDGTITVCFRTNGKLAVPEINPVTNVNEHGFTASWEPVEDATKYVIETEVECEVAHTDTLTELTIDYEDIKASTAVKFRVMAMADSPEDFISSDWSEYVYLSTDEDTIDELPDSEKMVNVYAMNGMPVSYCKASDLHRLFIRPGVYVVKYENGSTRKIVFK